MYFPVSPHNGNWTPASDKWVGKAGAAGGDWTTFGVTRCRLNSYLGYDTDGEEVPIARCTSDVGRWLRGGTLENFYDGLGASFDGSAGSAIYSDLSPCGAQATDPYISATIESINNPATMVFMANKDRKNHCFGKCAYAPEFYPDSDYGTWDPHGGYRFPFAFIDGHVRVHAVFVGMGVANAGVNGEEQLYTPWSLMQPR